MTDAALTFDVDSDGVAKATGRLTDLAKISEAAAKATDKLASSSQTAAKASDKLVGSQAKSRTATAELETATSLLLRAQEEVLRQAGLSESAYTQMSVAIREMEAAMVAEHRAAMQAVGGLDSMALATRRAGDAAESAALDFATMYDMADRDFAQVYAAGMGRVASSTRAAGGAAQLAGHEMLYFGRQLGDVVTMASLGASPLMILTTQGAQVAEGFSMVTGRGVTMTTMLRQMATSALATAAAIAPIAVAAAAVVGPFLLWRKHIEDVEAALEAAAAAQDKLASSQLSAAQALSEAIDFTERYDLANDGLTSALDEVISAQSAAYRETMAGIDATDKAAQAAARRAAMEQLLAQNTLLAAAADAEKRAGEAQKDVRAASRTAGLGAAMSTAWRLNPEMPGSADGLGMLEAERARREQELGLADLRRYAEAERKLADTLKAKALELDGVNAAAAAAAKAMQSFNGASSGAVGASGAARQAIDEQARAAEKLAQELQGVLQALETPEERQARELAYQLDVLARGFAASELSAEAYEEKVIRARNANLELVKVTDEVTIKAGGLNDVVLDDWRKELWSVIELYDRTQWAAQDLYRGVANMDWGQAFAGLLNLLDQIKVAFGEAGTAAQKMAAVTAVANVAGQAIGGKGGSVLSGAAGGAMAGFTVGGPIGAAIGAGIGGLGSLLGFDDQKKAEKAQREAAEIANALAAAQAQANRQAQLELELLRLSGDEVAYVTRQREMEIEGLDRTSAALQRQIYALQDWQKAVDAANDNVAKAEADLRAAYFAEVDRLNAIIGQVEDARQTLTAAYERERDAIIATKERFQDLADSLRALSRDLNTGPAAMLSPEQRYLAAKAEFERVGAAAMNRDPEALGQVSSVIKAFTDASRDYNASSAGYFRDLEAARELAETSAQYAESQVDIADQQLMALERQVDGLIAANDNLISVEAAVRGLLSAEQAAAQAQAELTALEIQVGALITINNSVLSVEAAIANLASATAALAQAQADKPSASPQGDTYEAVGFEGYVQRNADLAALYAAGTGMARGRSMAEFGQYHWERYGQGEDRFYRPFANGGLFGPGGVVMGPTAFPMGMAGEAGPEVIMPLSNNGGQMGVRAVTDPRVVEALNEVRDELRRANVQRGAAAEETIKRLENVVEGLERVERKTGDLAA